MAIKDKEKETKKNGRTQENVAIHNRLNKITWQTEQFIERKIKQT